MAKSTSLVSNEWKHSLETTPTKSVNSLVSLYDLIYDENGDFWIEQASSTSGTKLGHDIICLNKGMLTSSNTIDTTTTSDISLSSWWTYGIDISLPKYDSRAKYKVYQSNAAIGKGANIRQVFNGNTYRIYDKDAALAPLNIDIFTVNGVQTSSSTLKSPSWDVYTPPSIGVNTGSGKVSDYTEAIILSSEDAIFKSTLITQDGMEAYNRIFLNPYSVFTISLVAKALGINAESILGVSNGNYMNLTSNSIISSLGSLENFWNRNPVALDYVAWAINLNGNPNTDSNKVGDDIDNQRWFNILKETYVWVRAPFYADYVVPDSYDQDLHTSARVKHAELMLSGAGDFKKYDTYLTAESSTVELSNNAGNAYNNAEDLSTANPSEKTQPYLPRTSPTVDFYTSELVDKYLSALKADNTDQGNYSPRLKKNSAKPSVISEFLYDHVSGNNAIIKGLPVAAINRSNATNENAQTNAVENLVPVNYFDPESRYSDTEYQNMGRFPTILPTEGNLFVDGRIISPTIDELWYMVKKLVGGRLSDYTKNGDTTVTANTVRAVNNDLGIPYGNAENIRNDTDTTMTEVPESEFNFKYNGSTTINRHGDPVGFKYNYTDPDYGTIKDQKVMITKFINQNDAIVYPIYKSLKDLSEDITTFDYSENKDRGIKNFTAWNGVGKATTEKEVGGVTVTVSDVIPDNETVTTGVWAPRDVPYSLRELEAMIMANKYNLITQARFVKENFSVVGRLGIVHGNDNPDDLSNYTAGSIYQFHKDYNFDVTAPNTYYDATGTDTGYDANGRIVGAKAKIDDDDLRTQEQKSAGHIRFAETYGTSKYLNTNSEIYSSSDVYLAASGEWRYVSDHNRIPCLRAEY